MRNRMGVGAAAGLAIGLAIVLAIGPTTRGTARAAGMDEVGSSPPQRAAAATEPVPDPATAMRLGAFSVSLSVKDLAASRAFYEKLGFEVRGGNAAQNWLVMKNGGTVIGLFHGMFPKNMLTFNPGWDGDAKKLPDFEDVRTLQKRLKAQGVTLASEANEQTKGPASLVVIDPDGNPVLIDQHV